MIIGLFEVSDINGATMVAKLQLLIGYPLFIRSLLMSNMKGQICRLMIVL